jgi:divalent metal cation (Fe/Co/Zn/Cd) transporter
MSAGRHTAVIAVLADLAIGASKLVAFSFTGSAALLSEAIHSFVDAGNSSLLLLGRSAGRRRKGC